VRGLAWIGVLLLIIGFGMLTAGGVSYTTKETVPDLGPIYATANREHGKYFYPAAGIAGILTGIALIVVGRRT
jgi:hypothetical protein